MNANAHKRVVQGPSSESIPSDLTGCDVRLALHGGRGGVQALRGAPAPVADARAESLCGHFARNVRLWRHERSLSQAELASIAGLSTAFMTKIESGRSAVGLDTVERLAHALGIEPSLLIGPLCLTRPRLTLRELRESKGVSQSKLAEESGISRITINKIENGKTGLGMQTRRALAQALGVHPSTIM